MAHWDQKAIVYWPAKDYPGYPGWEIIDCGCCNGIAWGGESPEECESCGGTGVLCRHEKSKVFAEYPGGPFMGKDT